MKTTIIVISLFLATPAWSIEWTQETPTDSNGCAGFTPNIDSPSRDGISRINPYVPNNYGNRSYGPPPADYGNGTVDGQRGYGQPAVSHESQDNYRAYPGDSGVKESYGGYNGD